jgi:2',3'-cyclic-nucleotide 2'-phosphodiesterase (5'-nucleotidase family)
MRKILFLSFLFLISCKTNKVNHLADVDGSYLYFNKEDKEIDADIEALIAPYRTELAKEMDIVLIQNEQALKKTRPNSNMGQWIADLLKTQANEIGPKVDFAVQNYGGLRVPQVGVGPLTVGKIFEVMPFENMMVVMETDGALLQEFCDHMAVSGGWPISDGLEFTIEAGAKAKDIKINGELIQNDKTYRYAVPDYIANGGSDCSFFKDLPQQNSGMLIRDILLKYTKEMGEQGKSLNVPTVKRIK